MKTISEQRLNEIRNSILTQDFPHCAILDPSQVMKQLSITDTVEKELIFDMVKHVNCLVQ